MKKIKLLRLKFIDRITGLKIYDVLQMYAIELFISIPSRPHSTLPVSPL